MHILPVMVIHEKESNKLLSKLNESYIIQSKVVPLYYYAIQYNEGLPTYVHNVRHSVGLEEIRVNTYVEMYSYLHVCITYV